MWSSVCTVRVRILNRILDWELVVQTISSCEGGHSLKLFRSSSIRLISVKVQVENPSMIVSFKKVIDVNVMLSSAEEG